MSLLQSERPEEEWEYSLMTKHTVYLTPREENNILGAATDMAMEVNEWVSKQVMGFIYAFRHGGGIDTEMLKGDEVFLYADYKFNITDRQLMREYDIHGGDIHQSFYNFCHTHDVEPAKVIRLACTKGENWISKGYTLAKQATERDRKVSGHRTPEQISDETKEHFRHRYMNEDVPAQAVEQVTNEHEIRAAQHEQNANSLFDEIATKIGQLETHLLFLGHETLARELSDNRYGLHSIYKSFREQMHADAQEAKKKAEQAKRREIMERAEGKP